MSDAGVPPPLAIAASSPLAYAAPEHARPKVALYRIAQFCWAAPLIVGVGSLLLFFVTHEVFFAVVGFFTLIGGAGLFGIGFICLVVFWCLLRNCASHDRALWSKRSWILFGLMLLNFAIAYGCAVAGVWLMDHKH